MKVMSVVGARPQFVKIAVLSTAFRQFFQEVLVHTGQHYDFEMSGVFFESLRLPAPDYHLDVGSGGHGAQTGQMLERLEQVMLKERPDWVVVVGDTNSTLAGALAAAKLRIPVAHVEAGLRSHRDMPEEINRRLTDHVSRLLLTPTDIASHNLQLENVSGEIEQVGDVLVEAVTNASERGAGNQILEQFGISRQNYWLVTLHRAELTDEPATLGMVLDRLALLDGNVIFPMHPRTRAVIDKHELWSHLPRNVKVVTAVDVFEMLALERNARGIATDSGGVQREAFLLGVPCYTVRDETEWPETLADGWNQMVGRDAGGLALALKAGRPSAPRAPVFGDGLTSERIARMLLERAPTALPAVPLNR